MYEEEQTKQYASTLAARLLRPRYFIYQVFQWTGEYKDLPHVYVSTLWAEHLADT